MPGERGQLRSIYGDQDEDVMEWADAQCSEPQFQF